MNRISQFSKWECLLSLFSYWWFVRKCP